MAHSLNTIKMADGFAKLGHDVSLVCLGSEGGAIDNDQLSRIYNTTPKLEWIQLSRSLFGTQLLHEGLSFSWVASQVARRLKPDFIYARDYYVPWLCARAGIKTTVESHAHPGTDTFRFRRLLKAASYPAFSLWVTISEKLADYYVSRGVADSKIAVLPDAVDIELFSRPKQLPQSPYDVDRRNIVYAGHLYDYKGIPAILDAAKELPDVNFHLVGGWPEDIRRQRQQIGNAGLENVVLHGLKEHKDVPRYLWHADVLLLPPSANHPSAQWTSPLKLGEYLASGTPVIAADIPALRRWLTDEEVIFVEPDNGAAMAGAIRLILNDPERKSRLSEAGMEKAAALSYVKRASAICKRVGTKTGGTNQLA